METTLQGLRCVCTSMTVRQKAVGSASQATRQTRQRPTATASAAISQMMSVGHAI
jgi:hypothetical protein